MHNSQRFLYNRCETYCRAFKGSLTIGVGESEKKMNVVNCQSFGRLLTPCLALLYLGKLHHLCLMGRAIFEQRKGIHGCGCIMHLLSDKMNLLTLLSCKITGRVFLKVRKAVLTDS